MKKLIRIILLIQIIWLSQNEARAEHYSTQEVINASFGWEHLQTAGAIYRPDGRYHEYLGELPGLVGAAAFSPTGGDTVVEVRDVDLVGYQDSNPDRFGKIHSVELEVEWLPLPLYGHTVRLRGQYLDDGTAFVWTRSSHDNTAPGAGSREPRLYTGVYLMAARSFAGLSAEYPHFAPVFVGTTNTVRFNPTGPHDYRVTDAMEFTFDIDTDPARPKEELLPVVSGFCSTPLTYGSLRGFSDAMLAVSDGTWPLVMDGKYEGIGVHDIEVRATDWDGDTTTLPVTLTLRTSRAPELTIQYGAGAVDRFGNEIANKQYDGNDTMNLCGGEDGWTRFSLDVSVMTNSIDGDFDTVLTLPSVGETRATKGPVSREGYFVETTADGITATGALLPVGRKEPALSGTVSALMKIDATPPVAKATYSGGFSFKDDSEDALSGISTDGYPTQILFTAPGAKAPTAGDPDWATIDDHGMTTSGNYDVWILATDRAGNQHIDRAFANQYIGGEVNITKEGTGPSGMDGDSTPSGGVSRGKGFAGGVKTGDVVRMTGIVLLAIASSGIIVGILRKKKNKIINR